MKNYESWSTNFSNLTDLAAAGIFGFGNDAAIDPTNVNSGGKSIKVYGTLGPAGSCLNLSMGLAWLIRQDSVDLSDKTLNLEVYLPPDSPIAELMIGVFSNGKYLTVRTARDTMYKGQWHTYIVDIREDILLKSWRGWSSATSAGLTDAQAVDVLKHADMIGIVGGLLTDHHTGRIVFPG